MFLVSRPSKRFSTSSLRTARGGRGRCGLPPVHPPPAQARDSLTHSFMLSVREMSSSLEKSRMRKW